MIDDILLEAEEKMEKAIAVAREDFATLRTGRVNPAMFSKIVVDYYGAPTPLNQLASFHAADARMMLITPFDRNSINSVEKAIRDSDLGVNPATDGNVVRVVFRSSRRSGARSTSRSRATRPRRPGSASETSAARPKRPSRR